MQCGCNAVGVCRISVVVGGTAPGGGEENKNRKPLAVLRLSSVDTPVDDIDMNADPGSKRDDQVCRALCAKGKLKTRPLCWWLFN